MDPGSTLRFFEIHSTALRALLAEPIRQLGVLRSARKDRPSQATENPVIAKCLRLSIDITGFELCFAHHPLESWLATRAPLLAGAAAQRAMWEEALATMSAAEVRRAATGLSVGHSSRRADSVGHASSVAPAAQHSAASIASSSASFSVAAAAPSAASLGSRRRVASGVFSEVSFDAALPEEDEERHREDAWLRVQSDVAEAYASRVASLLQDEQENANGGADQTTAPLNSEPDTSSSVTKRLGDLFRVTVASLEGSVLLPALPHTSVVERLVSLDPPSIGVQFAKARLMEVDLRLGAVTLRVAACPQPFISLSAGTVSGTLIVAKQRTGRPATRERVWYCGRHASVKLPVSLKGTK